MSKATYEKPYAKNEWNFELNTNLDTIPNGNVVVKVGDCDVEVEIYGSDFVTTSGSLKDVVLDVIELDNPITSGGESVVLGVDYLRANRDRGSKDQSIDCVDIIKGTVASPIVFDVGTGEGGLNLFRNGASITKSIPSFQPQGELFFKYSLRKNQHYLIKTTGTSTEESFIFGLVREV